MIKVHHNPSLLTLKTNMNMYFGQYIAFVSLKLEKKLEITKSKSNVY